MSTSTKMRLLEAPRLLETTEILRARTAKSAAMAKDRVEVINGAMAASGESPPPIFIAENKGAYFTDIDGNSYLDTCMGFGVHILGHRHPAIQSAICEQAAKGWHFSLRGSEQLRLARLVQAAGPSNERVVFCNTGTEATLFAIRAARAMTGREKICIFSSSYHGAHDNCLRWPAADFSIKRRNTFSIGHGIPRFFEDATMVLPYRDPASLQVIEQHKHELAAVLVEPVQGSYPHPDVEAFLGQLSTTCKRSGIILIADEVLTGFRLAYGGAQERYGFEADMTTYGKAAGGGLPIGLIAGREEIMSAFSDFSKPKGIFFGGTFSGNPLTVAAGTAALECLRQHSDIYQRMDALTRWLCAEFNDYCAARKLPVYMLSAGSMFQVFFQNDVGEVLSGFDYDGKAAESAFHLHTLADGIFVHATHRCFLSAAHTTSEVERIKNGFIQALDKVQEDGLM